MEKRLQHVFRLSILESCIYQILLLTHHIALYFFIEKELYGHIGMLFSFIFLLANYSNIGLDPSLSIIFGKASTNKNGAKKIVLHLAGNVLTNLIACSIFWVWYKQPLQAYLLLCGALVLIESLKRSCKVILGNLLRQQCIAVTEIISLVGYITMVWAGIMHGIRPSVFSICFPLCISSGAALLLYGYLIFSWYQRLPMGTTDITDKEIMWLRIKNYLYQISNSWHSPNFLIPIIALHYSIAFAGTIKLVSMALYSMQHIMQHAFGISSTILFAQIKSYSIEQKRFTFAYLQKYLMFVIGICVVGICIHYGIMQPDTQYQAFYIFLLLFCIEQSAVAYEQFYLIEECTGFLLIAQGISIFPLIISAYYPLQTISFIWLVLGARIAYILIIHSYGWYHWQLQTALSYRSTYVSASAISFFLYVLFGK